MLPQCLKRRKTAFLTACFLSAAITGLGIARNQQIIRQALLSDQPLDVLLPTRLTTAALSWKVKATLPPPEMPQARKAATTDARFEAPVAPSITTPILYVYAPLDENFLRKSFLRLKETVKPLSMKYEGRVDELMVHQLPFIDTSSWRLHRTNGTNLTVQAVQQLTRDPKFLVPNVAHYILPFSDPNLQFHHLVCILSGFWVMQADFVILWYSVPSTGTNWDLLRQNLTLSGLWNTRLLLAHRSTPELIYQQPVLGREHKSDVMRMEALLVFGGAYFDLDVIALKPMTPLRNFSFTIGRELPVNLCNGVYLSAPNSSMLALWHLAYQTFDDAGWGEHSLLLPDSLCKAFDTLCHVESHSLVRPNFMAKEIVLIYGQQRGWNWRKINYAMHLWYRFHKQQYNMETIKYVDSMLGDMFRFVLYGNSSLWALPVNQTASSTPKYVTP